MSRIYGALLLVLCASTAASSNDGSPFGHNMLQYFQFRPGYVNLNHGSFGAVPKPVAAAFQSYFAEMEADPNSWFRGGYQPLMQAARAQVASYVSGNASDIVLVENTSGGINAVIRSLANYLNLGPDDYVLHMDIAYPMVKDIIAYLAQMRGFNIVNVTIPFPVYSDDDFIKPVAAAIATYGKRLRIAALDHYASYPACILPIKQLVQLCRNNGIFTVVDAAHVMGYCRLFLL